MVEDENTFYYCIKSRDNNDYYSKIIQISIGFQDYEEKIVAEEDEEQFDFMDFKIDQE